jgi:hypothetical protein
VTVRRAGQHAGQSPCQCVIPEDVLTQLFPPDDERLSLETCRGGKINTWKKWKECVKLVENPQLPQDARSTEYKILSYCLKFVDTYPTCGSRRDKGVMWQQPTLEWMKYFAEHARVLEWTALNISCYTDDIKERNVPSAGCKCFGNFRCFHCIVYWAYLNVRHPYLCMSA